MSNFWRLARSWNATRGRRVHPWDSKSAARFGTPWPNPHPPLAVTHPSSPGTVLTSTLHLPSVNAVAIYELFGARDESSPFVMLESLADPGRFTIIACPHSSSPRITYSIRDTLLSLHIGNSVSRIHLEPHDVWSWLSSFMSERKACDGSCESPFWGGLIGYLSYELGVTSLGVPSTAAPAEKRHPDVNLIFVERSIVLDSKTDIIYLQSIMNNDGRWLAETAARLKLIIPHHSTYSYDNDPSSTEARPGAAALILPDKELYISRINIAKEYLHAGDSYELCLTANTRVVLNNHLTHKASRYSSSWERYKHLRKLNPAPYSGFLRLHPTTLLASSPERFLSFSRPPGSTYQLRPIKGTVRKGPGITRVVAEQALRGSAKEVAENLMIVDLIRHDLHNVIGEDVEVTQFCTVEEYETLWQLVSVIQGRATDGADEVDNWHANGALGWELLRRSLPPGRNSDHACLRHVI